MKMKDHFKKLMDGKKVDFVLTDGKKFFESREMNLEEYEVAKNKTEKGIGWCVKEYFFDSQKSYSAN